MSASSSIIVWANGIKAELAQRLPGQRKTQRDKLAVLVATMLHVRSANLVELASGLPRDSDRLDMGYQWISRFLENDLVSCDTVMQPFAVDILARAAEPGEAIPLILDQSKLSDRHQVLMLGVRWGERALPLAWRVAETDGAPGFRRGRLWVRDPERPARRRATMAARRGRRRAVCRPLLRHARTDPPVPGPRLGLPAAAEEPALAKAGGNLTARIGSRKTSTGELASSGGNYFEAVALTGKRVSTKIGIIRDPGHAEPWIIAMSAKPGYLTTLDYAKRWGIEPMFSDFKSRGFGIEQTQIHYPDRVARLILVMALALYWAVSTGMGDDAENPSPAEKNHPTVSPAKSPEASSPGSPRDCESS